MWRVQVWKEQRIHEAFLCDTEEEAESKKAELLTLYPSSEFEFKMDEFRLNNFDLMDPVVGQILGVFLNPLNWIP